MHKLLLLASLVTSLSVAAAPAVFGERASVKVRPSHPLRDDVGVDLIAARNEFVSFQVVVHGTSTGAQGVTASFPGLGGPSSIGADRIVLYREALLNLTKPSGANGSTGLWPDGLVPDVDEVDGQKRKAFPFDVPASQARAIWVDVHVPADAPPGRYAGTVTVSGSGFSRSVAVRLTVVNATLPSTSSVASAFLIYGGTVCTAETGTSDCGGSTTRMSQALERYQRLALDHRITLTNIFKIGRQADNWSGFDAAYAKYLEGTAETRLRGARMTTAQVTATRDVSRFQAWAQHFRQRGWLDRLFDYTGDEPPYGISFSEALARAQATRSADPALRTLLTTTVTELEKNNLASLIDTVVPVINFMDGTASPYLGSQRSKYDGWLAGTGKRLWLYQSCMSHGCAYGTNLPENTPGSGWPSYMIDRSAAKNRAMQWLVFKYRASGELYYETALALATAWTDQFQFAGNGDGTLFYPGTPAAIGGTSTVPLPSIRLKQIRMGMQDYEWLKLVSDAGDPAFARQIVDQLLPAASKVPDDGQAFDVARAKLIQRYTELTASAPSTVTVGPDATTPETTAEAPSAKTTPGDDPPIFSDRPPVGIDPVPASVVGCSVAGGPSLLGLALAAAILRRSRRRR